MKTLHQFISLTGLLLALAFPAQAVPYVDQYLKIQLPDGWHSYKGQWGSPDLTFSFIAMKLDMTVEEASKNAVASAQGDTVEIHDVKVDGLAAKQIIDKKVGSKYFETYLFTTKQGAVIDIQFAYELFLGGHGHDYPTPDVLAQFSKSIQKSLATAHVFH